MNQATLNDTQKNCIENCQAKTYNTFDVYMQALYFKERDREFISMIDISKYAEFEIEHKENTNDRRFDRGDINRVNVEKIAEERKSFSLQSQELRNRAF